MPGKYTEMGLVFGDNFSQARAATMESQYKYAKERSRLLGGIPDVGSNSASYVDVPGAVVVELIEALDAKIHLMGKVSGGTGYFRLWDATAGAEVAGSEVAFTETTETLKKSSELALVAGHSYKLQVKASSSAQYVVAYGAQLVSQ